MTDPVPVPDDGYQHRTATFGLVDTGDGWLLENRTGDGAALVVPEVELWRLAQALCAAHVTAARARGVGRRGVAAGR